MTYEVYEKNDRWWFRCTSCGQGSGGYKTKEYAVAVAETHITLPHTP